MGVRNYLIEGVSGTGKTSVATQLERRGYNVLHGDRVLAYRGDPQTGAPLQLPPDATLAWRQAHHIWDVAKVRAAIADQSHPMTFFCGGSRNRQHFIALFDAIFVLTVDAATLAHRLMERPEDEFGGKPDERAFVLRLRETEDDIPRDGIRIDATAPLDQVVHTILQHCR